MPADVSPVIEEITKRIYTTGIVTIASEDGAESWDVKKEKKGRALFWAKHAENFPLRLRSLLTKYRKLAMIIRSFLRERHGPTGLPLKELRGYVIWFDGEKVRLRMLKLNELISACDTDAFTGKPLPAEEAVIYCGTDGVMMSDLVKR